MCQVETHGEPSFSEKGSDELGQVCVCGGVGLGGEDGEGLRWGCKVNKSMNKKMRSSEVKDRTFEIISLISKRRGRL